MSSGNWYNSDDLYLQYGTSKTTDALGGDYLSYGANRVAEVLINLASLSTSTSTVVSLTTLFPNMANYYIEAVEAVAEVGMSTGSSPTLSVGLGYGNPTSLTFNSNGATALISAQAASGLSTAGDKITYTAGTTSAGSYIGDYEDTTNLTNAGGYYITAKLGTATATGMIRVRVYYHGVGTISN